MKLSVVLALTLFLPVSVTSAATMYSYAGNQFDTFFSDDTPPIGSYDSSHRVTGMFLVVEPLVEMEFGDISPLVIYAELSDGRNTLSAPDKLYNLFLEVDSSGVITRWKFAFFQSWSRPSFVGEVRIGINTEGGGSFTSFDSGEISICTKVSEFGTCVIGSANRDIAWLRSGGGFTAGE